jgi:transposase
LVHVTVQVGAASSGILGLVTAERSSGTAIRPRGITKVGNNIAWSHLLEAAWCYRLRAKIGPRLVRLDSSLPEIAKEIAWKAQVRHCRRYRRLLARGKKSQLVTTAIARELVGFIWANGREFRPASPAA